MTPETKVKNKLKKYFKEWEKNYPVWWTGISDRFRAGVPEFEIGFLYEYNINSKLIPKGTVKSFFFKIECKAPKEKLRPLQIKIRNKMIAAGIEYRVYRGEELTASIWDLYLLPDE